RREAFLRSLTLPARPGSRAQPAQLVDDLVKPLALDELHGVETNAPLLADLENGHNVGVVQPGRRLGLAAEALSGQAVSGGVARQDLQGHAPAQRRLFRLVDHPHAAFADFPQEAVIPYLLQRGTAAEHRRLKALLLDLLDLDQGREEVAD